jgi:hypothetical protein
MKIHVCLVILKFIMVVTKQQKMVAYIYTLLWLNNSPYPNTLIQTLHDDESFRKNMINYLNIIMCNVDKYELSNPMTQNNNNKYDDHIHPCAT